MKTTSALALGSLMLVSLTAFSLNARSAGGAKPAFDAEIRGEVSARPSGEARFGVTGGSEGVPAVFTISLGANAEEGSILFTRRSGAPLTRGVYTITARADGSDDIRALVMTGSPTRPTGVFQGHAGVVEIAEVTDTSIRGSFRIEAAGYLAAEPELEGRPVKVSGSFAASAY